MVMVYPQSVLLYSIFTLLFLFIMPRRNDGDNRYDAYLDMRDADEEYVGECHGMDCEPYDVFIDIFDEEEEAEEGDEYADYHDARVRWSAWTSDADAHERGLLLDK